MRERKKKKKTLYRNIPTYATLIKKEKQSMYQFQEILNK